MGNGSFVFNPKNKHWGITMVTLLLKNSGEVFMDQFLRFVLAQDIYMLPCSLALAIGHIFLDSNLYFAWMFFLDILESTTNRILLIFKFFIWKCTIFKRPYLFEKNLQVGLRLQETKHEWQIMIWLADHDYTEFPHS